MTRFLPYSILGLAPLVLVFVSACGKLDADPASSKITTEADLRRCRGPATAEIATFDDVEDRSVVPGPCGEVMFAKADKSLWLRREDGELVRLAESGRGTSFDVTGSFVSYSRGADGVLRDLRTGTETTLAGHPVIQFGYDEATKAAVPFACGPSGIRAFRGAEFAPPIAETAGVSCRQHAPLGTVVTGEDDADHLVFVDLVRGTKREVPGIRFMDGKQEADTNASRQDFVYLSKDGRIAFYQLVRQRLCGDTSCAEPSGFDVLRTDSGAVVAHSERGLGHVFGSAELVEVVDRPGTLVFAPRSGGKPFSVDTRAGVYREHPEVTILSVLGDGRFTFTRRSAVRGKVDVFLAGPDGSETKLVELATDSQRAMFELAPDGRRMLFAEHRRCVYVTGSPGTCDGGAPVFDLVLRDGERELLRKPALHSMSTPRFLADGTALIHATWYAGGEPPADAPMGELEHERGIFSVSPAGDVRRVDIDVFLDMEIVELSPRFLAYVDSTYDGRARTTRYRVFDRDAERASTLAETEQSLEVFTFQSSSSNVAPALAFAVANPRESNPTSPWTVALTHGVPR